MLVCVLAALIPSCNPLAAWESKLRMAQSRGKKLLASVLGE